MGDSPSDRCGYTYPEDYDVGDIPDNQNCCYRETLSDTDRCAWHATPDETDEKTVDALQAARAPFDVRKQNSPYAELLDGAILSSIELGNVISFENTALRNADFTDAKLQHTNLTNAGLQGADLTLVKLDHVNLTEANLWGADLFKATLFDVDLTNAILRSTTLINAYIVADLTNANLIRATLTDATLMNAILTNANLTNATLTDADLRSADLPDANLRLATLTNTTLAYTDFSRANLEGTSLSDADLDQADLTDARLHNCRLQGVYISDETTFGDRCAYERDADPYDILPWEVVGPSMEPVTLTADNHHLYQGGRLAAAWHRFRYWTGRLSDQSPDSDDSENIEKAISIYRTYQRLLRENSLPGDIPNFYYREKEMRRVKALAERDIRGWLYRALQRWVMGYGERPWRVVGTSLGVIAGFGLVYPFVGGMEATDTDTVAFSLAESFSLPLRSGGGRIFFENLYFSAVTFTTLGYGDIQPGSDTAKLLASFESFLGALLMALLVAVLTRRTMR